MVWRVTDAGVLDGKIAIVTGASRGVGVAIAHELLRAGGTVPTPHAEDVPALVAQIQGAPRADDDFERTALFHAFAVQMNLISPP